jgi:MoaA/NifB/PqqE/SkfB family radical SAM enzyme
VQVGRKARVAWSLMAHPARVRHAPVQANIEVTSECNLDCIMCDRARTIGRGASMSFETFRRLCDDIMPSTINFSGNGEPLINRHVYDMVRYASSRGIRTHMTSNFTAARKNAEKIVTSGLDFMKISLDGATEATFQHVRGTQLGPLLDGVRAVTAVRDELGRRTPRIRINMVVLNSNHHEIADMIRLAHEHGIDGVQYKYCQTFNLQKGDVADSIPYEAVRTEIGRARRLARRLRIDHNLHLLEQEVRLLLADGGAPAARQPVCIAPWTWVYVDVHGKVAPCCYFAYRQLEDHFGVADGDNFESIWNGETYRRFRDEMARGERRYAVCRHCIAPTLGSVAANWRNLRNMIQV